MGTYSVGCKLSGQLITEGTEVVGLLTTNSRRKQPIMLTDSWDLFAPVPIFFTGIYNGVGGLSDVKLYSNSLSEEELDFATTQLVETLKTRTIMNDGDNIEEPISSLDDLLNKENETAFLYGFGAKESYMKFIAQIEASKTDTDSPETIAKTDAMIAQIQNKIDTMTDEIPQADVYFYFAKKELFEHLIENFASNPGEYEDTYANDLRNTDNIEDRESALRFVGGTDQEQYASGNYPIFSFKYVSNNITEKSEKDIVHKLAVENAVNLCILNQYIAILGKTFDPNVYVTESAYESNLQSALDIQKELTSENISKKKKNTI